MALEHNDYDTDSLKDFNYPFTNIVLEGGGSKGLAYVGALQVHIDKTFIFDYEYSFSLWIFILRIFSFHEQNFTAH